MHIHYTKYLLIFAAKMTIPSIFSFLLQKLLCSFCVKSDKISEDYAQRICTYPDHDLNTCKFQTTQHKTVGRDAYTIYLVSIHFGRKMTKYIL